MPWPAMRPSARREGLVPIVEPEVLIDGDHTLERCWQVTDATLHEVFNQLPHPGSGLRPDDSQAQHGDFW